MNIDPRQAIGKQWVLLTAQHEGKVNTMTASWGLLGHLWNEDVIEVFIRQSRYTKSFFDQADTFCVNFFSGHKKALSYLGSHSGRDEDKIKNSGLHLRQEGQFYLFDECDFTILAKKIYVDDIKPENMLDQNLLSHYPDGDFHTRYIGRILDIYETPSVSK